MQQTATKAQHVVRPLRGVHCACLFRLPTQQLVRLPCLTDSGTLYKQGKGQAPLPDLNDDSALSTLKPE